MGWKGSVLLLSYVRNIPRRTLGRNAGDGEKPPVERSAAVPGPPAALRALAYRPTTDLSRPRGVVACDASPVELALAAPSLSVAALVLALAAVTLAMLANLAR